MKFKVMEAYKDLEGKEPAQIGDRVALVRVPMFTPDTPVGAWLKQEQAAHRPTLVGPGFVGLEVGDRMEGKHAIMANYGNVTPGVENG